MRALGCHTPSSLLASFSPEPLPRGAADGPLQLCSLVPGSFGLSSGLLIPGRGLSVGLTAHTPVLLTRNTGCAATPCAQKPRVGARNASAPGALRRLLVAAGGVPGVARPHTVGLGTSGAMAVEGQRDGSVRLLIIRGDGGAEMQDSGPGGGF